jgi:alpha-beta hydrolase superfamily lysophospholipase
MKLEVITRKPKNNPRTSPILFVHGMYHCARCREENFTPYFAEHGFETHAISLRGHGLSEGRDKLRWFSIKDYLSDLDKVVNQIETIPVLVGHSMGGLLIQKYLQSNQAAGAVLLGAVSPKGLLPVTLRVLARHPLVFLKVNLTLNPYHAVGTPERYRELFYSPDFPKTKLSDCFSRIQQEAYRAYIDMVLLPLNLPSPIDHTPILVLGAANDTSISPGEVELTARRYNTQAEILPDIGHAMMLDNGWQSVADRILVWLNKLAI